MLNKVKVAMIVGIAIQALSFFVPDFTVEPGTQNAIVIVVMFAAQLFAFWQTRETVATIAKLDTK